MDYKIINIINAELLHIRVNIVFSTDVISVPILLNDLKNYGIAAIKYAAERLAEASIINKHSFTEDELYNLLLNNFLKLYAERYI